MTISKKGNSSKLTRTRSTEKQAKVRTAGTSETTSFKSAPRDASSSISGNKTFAERCLEKMVDTTPFWIDGTNGSIPVQKERLRTYYQKRTCSISVFKQAKKSLRKKIRFSLKRKPRVFLLLKCVAKLSYRKVWTKVSNGVAPLCPYLEKNFLKMIQFKLFYSNYLRLIEDLPVQLVLGNFVENFFRTVVEQMQRRVALVVLCFKQFFHDLLRNFLRCVAEHLQCGRVENVVDDWMQIGLVF